MAKKDPNAEYMQYVIRNDKGLPNFIPSIPMPSVKPPRKTDTNTNSRANSRISPLVKSSDQLSKQQEK